MTITPCNFCGGADSTRWGMTDHLEDCPQYWHRGYEGVIALRLNAYQAANILAALMVEYPYREGQDYAPFRNSGDWVGEVHQQLVAKMKVGGKEFMEYIPNGGGPSLKDREVDSGQDS